jgi:hypothetical protein
MGDNAIVRKPLLSASLGTRSVTSVDVREITFAPGQQTGRHKHPCPVILRFDNASSSAPMKFIAHYLLNGKQELIEMLPETRT